MILTATLVPILILLALFVTAALKTFGVNQEYERAVLFRLGRLGPQKGAGWFWLVPWVDRVVKVDLRTMVRALDTQETVTRDGVAVRVNAVLWYKAEDATTVVTTVEDWQGSVIQAAETALRDAIGQSDLDQMLKERILINKRLQDMLARVCLTWGVTVESIELKDLDIPEQMQRAIGREAEAIREKRARIIKAEGEQEAAEKLTQAAALISATPGAIDLRRLQTLSEIGTENSSTIIAMMPIELLEAAKRIGQTPAP